MAGRSWWSARSAIASGLHRFDQRLDGALTTGHFETAMTFDQITFERHGPAAWVTLCRPAELNALTAKMVGELAAAFDVVDADPDILCVIVTGQGRAFCSGADLKSILDFPADERVAETDRFLDKVSRLVSRIESIGKPVIAAVNGIATAGGMEIILGCDIVIASAEAKLGDGHANYGLLPGAGASVRLARKVGTNHAKYLFFTGSLLPVSDPIFTQLVTRIVPGAELVATVEALADQIGEKSSLALQRTKTLVNAALQQSIEAGLAAELDANRTHINSHDYNEGLAAFSERRRPVFLGR